MNMRAAWAGFSAVVWLLLSNSQSSCSRMVDPWSQLLFAAFLLLNAPPAPVCSTLSIRAAWGGFHTHLLTAWRAMLCALAPLNVGSLLLSAWNPAACLSRSISVMVGKCSLEISPLLHFTFMFYSGSQAFQFFPLEYSLQQRPCWGSL